MTSIPSRFQSKLETRWLGREALFFEALESTNLFLKNLPQKKPGLLVVATRQSAGYGSKGRMWSSPSGGAYFSFLLPWAPSFTLFPTVVGLACARAIGRFGCPVRLKWPNDLVLFQRKLGGILVESRHEEWAVAGIGINVLASSFPEAASLDEIEDLCPEELIACIANELEPLWEQLQKGESEEVLRDWAELSATAGQLVRVQTKDGNLLGRALSLDSLGGLRMMTEDGSLTTIYEGTLRRPDGGYV